MLAESYLKINYKDKEYKIEELYKEYHNQLNLHDNSKESFYCGLPSGSTIIYRNTEYNSEDYDKLLDLENLQMISGYKNFNNNYLNLLYEDFIFQFQMARVNLIKSIPVVQSDTDINWSNINAYVGMHYFRLMYFLNSSIAYRHLIDKLYKILGIIIEYNKKFETFKKYIKGIDDREKFNKYWESVVKNETVNGVKIQRIEKLRKGIDDLADFLNDTEISMLVNQYKHQGLYIEKGMQIEHLLKVFDKKDNSYIIKAECSYDEEILEFDLDEKIKALREYNNKVVEFTEDENTKDIFEYYKFDLFDINI